MEESFRTWSETSPDDPGPIEFYDEVDIMSGRHFTATRDRIAKKSDISSTDPTFSNEVAKVARSVQPSTVRTYDSVRHCWWVLEMVNGVPTWTVED